jgi:hypothetical protein
VLRDKLFVIYYLFEQQMGVCPVEGDRHSDVFIIQLTTSLAQTVQMIAEYMQTAMLVQIG